MAKNELAASMQADDTSGTYPEERLSCHDETHHQFFREDDWSESAFLLCRRIHTHYEGEVRPRLYSC